MKEYRSVIDNVCKKYSIETKDVLGKSRKGILVNARTEIVRGLRKKGLSFPKIGIILGLRDHHTIISLSKRKIVKYKEKRVPIRRGLIKIVCKFCSHSFSSRTKLNKFCSDKCRYSFSRKNIVKRKYVCTVCGGEYLNSRDSLYCSKICKRLTRKTTGTPLAREFFLEKANFMCEECCSVNQLQCHHRIPLFKGGKDTPENIIVLCLECHWRKHSDDKPFSTR